MIRRATQDDAEAIARLHQEVRAVCLPYLPVLHTPASVLGFFRDRVLITSEVWVAGGDTIDGFCAFHPGWVDHLYVYPARHGQGLGTALLGQAMAVNSGLRLWAFQRNTNAIRFYRARGFSVVRETDGGDNEEREPDVLMEWGG